LIRTLKKQLFNSQFFLPFTLLLSLVVFFLFASLLNSAFFIYLVAGLLITIFYLIRLNGHLTRYKAEADLQIQNLYEQRNLLDAEMDKESASIQSFRKKIINYSHLKGLTERLNMCLYTEDTSRALSAEVNKMFGEKETMIILYLLHSKTGELGISISHKGQMKINIKSKKGDIFDQWLVKNMQPLLIEDTKSDFRFDLDKVVSEDPRDIRSMISVPLMIGNKALGILRVDSPKPDQFDTEDLRLLTTIGDLGAVAIENAQLFERVERLAIRDGLTDLYLRRYLMSRLPQEINRHMRGGTQLSFLMLDLDKFKQYNDQFGHMAGDIVLRTVGVVLAEFLDRPGNLVCRYGGEEFAVLLPECPKSKAVEIAEEIRERISQQTVILRREKTNITASIGVATFPVDAHSKEELIDKADQALYKAKSEGRNRVCAA